MTARLRLAAALVVAAASLTGCAFDRAGGPGRETLTVLAASSLTESFDQLAKTFEKEHPGVDVRLTYDSSATLAQQVVQGAPADVLATADARTMQAAVDGKGVAGTPRKFATNRLVLVVPAANPAHLTGIGDLTRPRTTFVMCDVSAPCGALSRTVLATNHVRARPRSLEPDVKSVLTKVTLGEADAGLVYASDAKAAGTKVRAFAVPSAAGEVNSYLIGRASQSRSPGLAAAWVDLVTSARGQRVLRAHGFGRP
jgi:molybdate transport system substrate-binding protein